MPTLNYENRRGLAPVLEHHAHRIVYRLAHTIALIGGGVLLLMVLLTVISIAGRQLSFVGLSGIPGDYELIEIGCAFALFCFLPWCQLLGGHATVDIFVSGLSRRVVGALEFLWNMAMSSVAAVILWRLYLGMMDKKQYQETTLILEIPLWIGYCLGLLGASFFVVVAIYTVWRSINDIFSGEATSYDRA